MQSEGADLRPRSLYSQNDKVPGGYIECDSAPLVKAFRLVVRPHSLSDVDLGG